MLKGSVLQMLQINEIYPAICGESRFSGRTCTLIRLTGCHLRCVWCDSEHSFQGGDRLSVDQCLAQVRKNGFRTVLVTGGEPLLQSGVIELMDVLLSDGRTVLLETSGTTGPPNLVPLDRVPDGVHRIVDVKAPGSSIASDLIDWQGIAGLDARDEIKIVCTGRADYEWARDSVIGAGRIPADVPVILSPVAGQLEPAELAEWILSDGLEVVFGHQLHKVIWPGVERGV